jgi:hypothetical protein
MKRISAIGAALACLVLAPAAHADEFYDACMLGNSPASDMPKTCACISTKIAPEVRADATAALRRSYESTRDASRSIDPSTLPPNLMRGLQAYVAAQADCL